MRWKWLLTLILLLPFAAPAFAQSTDNSAPPLGDVAKKNKDVSKDKDKATPKHIFTDDDMSVRKSPIPPIALVGVENTQLILDALHEFKSTHDAAATEQMVHAWFDEESQILSDAIDNNNRLAQHNRVKMEATQDRYGYGNPYYGVYDSSDYTKMREHQLSEMWAQRSDARSNQDNYMVIMRIQQAFFRVRCDAIFNRGKTAYDWFRIRNANGVGTY
jgi:hypothetical protein